MWTIKYTGRFLKELSKTPRDIQEIAEKIVFVELKAVNPFSLGCVERLKGSEDKYKIRIKDYRIGLKINKRERDYMLENSSSERYL